MKIWTDGQWQTPDNRITPSTAAAFQYGFGLFETLRIQDGLPSDLEAHAQRLLLSINKLDSNADYSFNIQQLVEKVNHIMKQYEATDGVLKIIAYRKENN